MKPFYVLGVDGGGTQSQAEAQDSTGRVLFRLTGGALNINGSSYEAVRRAFSQLLAEAAEEAGEELELAAICAGIAGISNPDAARAVREGATGFDGKIEIIGDHSAALAGALGKSEGLILIAGTGSVCAGIGADGREARSGGWGHLIDDEGSGYAMGRDALRAIIKAEDGRAEPTILKEAVFKALGIEDIAGLMAFVYDPRRPKSDMAALARLILPDAAAAGDQAALAIYRRASEELALLVTAVAGQLGIRTAELALCGSLLGRDKRLRDSLCQILEREQPGLIPLLPRNDAASGAAQRALHLAKSAGNADRGA